MQTTGNGSKTRKLSGVHGAGDERVRLTVKLASGFGTALLLLPALLLSPTQARAQSVAATLTGTVTDASGSVIPNAIVTVRNEGTGITRTTHSNGEGLYTVPQLQPGAYSVSFASKGYETVQRNDVELQVNQTATLPIMLPVGAATQKVTVTGQTPLLETQTVALGTVVGAKEIADLPLDGRQFAQLLQLVPGTVPISVSQTASAVPLGSGSTNPSINGGSNRSNLFFIDNIFSTNPTYSYYAIDPSVDAIQEFQEQTHADEAEFGQSTGGTINIALKSGTNHYHGNAYEFLRNDAVDAQGYFAPYKGAYKQNQFGGTLGGPILKNRLFAFGYYEGYRSVTQSVNQSVLPTAAELGGDFSALLPNTVIYDPKTYDAATNTAQPFSGNMIPGARLNQTALTTLKAFLPAQLPTVAGITGDNYINTANATVDQNEFGIRGDYTIGEKDLLYGQYLYQEGVQVTPDSLPGNAFTADAGAKNAGLNWVHTFSPTTTMVLTGGWLRATSPGYYIQPNPLQLFQQAGFAAGFTPNPGAIAMSFVPSIGISNGYAGINSGEGGDVDNVYQVSGSVTEQLGKHSLKFGAAGYRATLETNYANDGESFNQQATQNPCGAIDPTSGACVGTGGDGLASTLLGLPVSASRQLGNSAADLFAHIYGVYAEDTWKFTSKLTVDYGIRWDYTSPVTDAENRLSGFNIHNGAWYIPKGDADTPSVIPAGVYIAATNHITSPNYNNFSPRLGFAYSVNPKLAIRAGAGVFFDNWAGAIQAAQNARGGWPSGGSQSTSNTNIAGLTEPSATAANPFGSLAPVEPTTPYPSGADYLDTAWKNAYSWQWNLQVEQQLSNTAVMSFTYAGSSTSRSTVDNPSNQVLDPGPGAVQPYPQMAEFGELSSIGHMSYNSFQAKYDQRYANGVAVTGAFTWSKDIDVGCADFWEGCSIQNGHDLAAERADSELDVPIVVTLSTVYKLPFGKGEPYLQSGVRSALLGNWHLNGIFAYHSGLPFTPAVNFDNAMANGGSQRPNVIADADAGPHTLKEYFNTAAFTVAPPYKFGDAGRDSLRGPAYTNLDTSVFRDFALYREATLQFRGEFFNVLNHPQFGTPDGTLEDATYGQITSTTGNPRNIQFALKLSF
jgi:hypothetical protein